MVWALIIAGLIYYASSRSIVVSTGVTRIDDKFVHFAVYGLLGTLVCRIRWTCWRAAFGSWVLVAAYGASDEWHQSFVPGRSMDLGDWIADTLGAGVAIGLYTGWTWYRELLERPIWSRQRRIENS
jgi:VanZ family protein